MTDRHWAQYNRQSAMLSAKGGNAFVFWAGNPAREASAYALSAQPMAHEALQREPTGSLGVVLFGYAEKACSAHQPITKGEQYACRPCF